MLSFICGFILGAFLFKFALPLWALWKRTEKKIEKSINEANKD